MAHDPADFDNKKPSFILITQASSGYWFRIGAVYRRGVGIRQRQAMVLDSDRPWPKNPTLDLVSPDAWHVIELEQERDRRRRRRRSN